MFKAFNIIILYLIIEFLCVSKSIAMTELICQDTDVNGFLFDSNRQGFIRSSFKKEKFKIVIDNNQSSIMINIPGLNSTSEFRCEKGPFLTCSDGQAHMFNYNPRLNIYIFARAWGNLLVGDSGDAIGISYGKCKYN